MRRRRPDQEPEAKSGVANIKAKPQTPWLIEVRYVAVRRSLYSGDVAEQLGPFDTAIDAERALIGLDD